MTEAELSQASGAGPELLRRLVALGIVPARDGEHHFVPGDIHRVRLAQAFERSGRRSGPVSGASGRSSSRGSPPPSSCRPPSRQADRRRAGPDRAV